MLQGSFFREWRLPLLLFAATVLTTTLAGAAQAGGGIGDWPKGLPFSIPLLSILLTHELGHFLTARRHGVDVSPPYFIPLPPMLGIGTLGAVIRIREPITSRNALLRIGAAGPIAGFIAAAIVLSAGIALSPVEELPPRSAGLLTEGNSLFYAGLKWLIHGEFLPSGNRDMMMHPMAFAGWIGLFITMINLVPVGQLDGGHVAFAWWGDGYARASAQIHRLLPALGIAAFAYVLLDEHRLLAADRMRRALAGEAYAHPSWLDAASTAMGAAMPWFLWPALLWGLIRISGGDPHPQVGRDELNAASRRLALAVAVLFVLVFMPVPMRVSG